ncbi:MAG: LPS export ABC transporter ATP-binding protein [Holosporales bacterium]|jgi:lipopolysaccharide export system ATP-binding protein|nr:LPS export ABC transporter ATP-binding protein [Holosporales bacterium]
MIFKAENIIKTFGTRLVLNGIDVSFSKNEIVGILGPNGAGKTTLFSILVGISASESGTITLGGKDITKLKIYQRAQEGIIYLPQDSSVFKGLTVEENILSILQIKYRNKEQINEKLNDLLDSFSLTHLRKVNAAFISGGEKRKVEIARALAASPSFLMLDEPFSGIDPISISEITNIIKSLNDTGIGIIITDHNVREMLNIIDKGYIITNGKVLISGSPKEILEDQESRRLYLGSTYLF